MYSVWVREFLKIYMAAFFFFWEVYVILFLLVDFILFLIFWSSESTASGLDITFPSRDSSWKLHYVKAD